MIAAAGSGQRLGAGGPKAFVELAGVPLLAYSLRALAAAAEISAVIIAAPADHLEPCRRLAADCGSEAGVIAGGATRAESVRLALATVETELVLVHDAARPLAPPELFDEVVRTLRTERGADAAIAASPLLDTVKSARNAHGTPPEIGEVEETVPRERLWAAQTPQGFRVEPLRAAQRRAADRGELETATDEARLIELAGGRVLVMPADGPNPKVTTKADLALVEALLAAR